MMKQVDHAKRGCSMAYSAYDLSRIGISVRDVAQVERFLEEHPDRAETIEYNGDITADQIQKTLWILEKIGFARYLKDAERWLIYRYPGISPCGDQCDSRSPITFGRYDLSRQVLIFIQRHRKKYGRLENFAQILGKGGRLSIDNLNEIKALAQKEGARDP